MPDGMADAHGKRMKITRMTDRPQTHFVTTWVHTLRHIEGVGDCMFEVAISITFEGFNFEDII